jgi:hypothetical protein
MERRRKEAVVAWFKVLTRYLPGGTEENNEEFPLGLDLNTTPPEYETGLLTSPQRR